MKRQRQQRARVRDSGSAKAVALVGAGTQGGRTEETSCSAHRRRSRRTRSAGGAGGRAQQGMRRRGKVRYIFGDAAARWVRRSTRRRQGSSVSVPCGCDEVGVLLLWLQLRSRSCLARERETNKGVWMSIYSVRRLGAQAQRHC